MADVAGRTPEVVDVVLHRALEKLVKWHGFEVSLRRRPRVVVDYVIVIRPVDDLVFAHPINSLLLQLGRECSVAEVFVSVTLICLAVADTEELVTGGAFANSRSVTPDSFLSELCLVHPLAPQPPLLRRIDPFVLVGVVQRLDAAVQLGVVKH